SLAQRNSRRIHAAQPATQRLHLAGWNGAFCGVRAFADRLGGVWAGCFLADLCINLELVAWRKLLDGLRCFAPLSILRVLVIIGGVGCGGWNPRRGFRHGGLSGGCGLLVIVVRLRRAAIMFRRRMSHSKYSSALTADFACFELAPEQSYGGFAD
ncbi:hypothetical protein, partial [Pseudomonas sp.]|uniref:hypothetical protein n=1 Tax=Pseudomonas sp. TaxID=306 RepID=UPI0025808F0A